jgi:hypothetical protein
MLLGSCGINLSEADMTTVDATNGEVYTVEWHFFNGDVFGLTQTGSLFRWETHEDEANDKVETDRDFLTVSRKGSLQELETVLGQSRSLHHQSFPCSINYHLKMPSLTSHSAQTLGDYTTFMNSPQTSGSLIS